MKLGVLEEGLGLVAAREKEGKTTLLWGNSGIMERERPPGTEKVKVKGFVERKCSTTPRSAFTCKEKT